MKSAPENLKSLKISADNFENYWIFGRVTGFFKPRDCLFSLIPESFRLVLEINDFLHDLLR